MVNNHYNYYFFLYISKKYLNQHIQATSFQQGQPKCLIYVYNINWLEIGKRGVDVFTRDINFALMCHLKLTLKLKQNKKEDM